MKVLVCLSKYYGFHPEAVKGLKQKSIASLPASALSASLSLK